MDNLDDSENNAKISDSAYSNSCSNSQSRRSSKSTRSGSNSSGSSGYGGKPGSVPSGYSTNLSQLQEKRIKEKEVKKKNKVRIEQTAQVKKGNQRPPAPVFQTPQEVCKTVACTPPSCVALVQSEKRSESVEVATPGSGSNKEELDSSNSKQIVSLGLAPSRRHPTNTEDGFMCVISMQDGVVMYTAPTITTALGYPKELWVGRSFLDFVHPRDCNTFASQITNGLAIPKNEDGTLNKEPIQGNLVCSMVCRLRRYRDLSRGFGIRDKTVTYMPFTLKFYFKNFGDDDSRTTYLLIQASPFYSAFKTPNEAVIQTQPFVIRHSATGCLEYIDQESVPFLGYLPQDILNKDALLLYHPGDLIQLCKIYETIVREGSMPRSKPYRMMAQNGHYLKVETEWSSFINPWSKKLEFVIGKHYIVEGPGNPDVFQSPEPEYMMKLSEEDMAKTQVLRHTIVRLMNEVLTKPAVAAKQQMGKRCQDLASFMETLMEEGSKDENDLRLDIDADHSYFERDSVMLGGISPHHDSNESKSSTDTPVSYNELNYNENLQRFFNSHEPFEVDPLAVPENKWEIDDSGPTTSKRTPSEDYDSSRYSMEKEILPDSCGGMMPTVDTSYYDDYQQIRLTEFLLNKHNEEMEKKLVKMARENKSSKSERERVSSETRKKKKEHLARCNAYYQPSSAGVSSTLESLPTSYLPWRDFDTNEQYQDNKWTSKLNDQPSTSTYKHRWESSRNRRRQNMSNAAHYRSHTVTTAAMLNSPWQGGHASNMNGYMLGLEVPQPTNIIPYPVHNAAHTNRAHYPVYNHATRPAHHAGAHAVAPHLHNHVPCMMLGPGFYGQPFLYSSVYPQHFAMPQTFISPELQSAQAMGLPNRTYEEAIDNSSQEMNRMIRSSSSGTMEKTDEESSYSSFYSSFFKTDSGSAEDSDAKNNSKGSGKIWQKKRRAGDAMSLTSMDAVNPKRRQPMKVNRIDEVRLTSELIYKYQIVTKNMEEVLSRDRDQLLTYEQPDLVNDQLEQLYLDLQLEGVTARLTLEEGITSSSSSGEDSPSRPSRTRRRIPDYSRQAMIHGENAPMPPPDYLASSSTS